jgi:Flp pilus assembly protein TadG
VTQSREDRGQSTVEFALVLPLLVVCLGGLIWVGQLMTWQVRLEHAAREGARAAAVEPENAGAAASTAVSRVAGEMDVSTELGPEFVVVRVSRTVDGVPWIGVGERQLWAEAHMRREDIINQP